MLLILRIYLQFSEESCCLENPESRRIMRSLGKQNIFIYILHVLICHIFYVSQSIKSLGSEQTSEGQIFIYLYFMFLNCPSPSENIMKIIIAK